MVDFVELLPDELTQKIFSNLTPNQLAEISRCSRMWRHLSGLDVLWMHHCMVNGWLKYGVSDEVLFQQSSSTNLSNVSGTSPTYTYDITPECDLDLQPTPKWKSIYARARHLRGNWCKGRYTVGPILRGHNEPVTALDSDGRVAVSGSGDKTLRIWDLRAHKCSHLIRGFADTVTAVHIHRGRLVAGCADCSIHIYNILSGKLELTFHGNGSVDHLHLHGDTLVSVTDDKSVRVWSLHAKKLVHSLRGHTDDVECLQVYSHMACTGSWDKTMILWDIRKGTGVHTLAGHSEVVSCCQFDNRKVVSGSADGTVRIWNVETGECTDVLEGHTEDVYCVVYNAAVIASGSADSTIRIWTHRGQMRHVLKGHLGIVRCLYIDGEKLVSAGDAKKICVWDYNGGVMLNMVHRNPTLANLMWVNATKLITSSPEKPGTITVLSYW